MNTTYTKSYAVSKFHSSLALQNMHDSWKIERYICKTLKTATFRQPKIPAHNCTFEKVYAFLRRSRIVNKTAGSEMRCAVSFSWNRSTNSELTHGQLQKRSSAVCVCFRTWRLNAVTKCLTGNGRQDWKTQDLFV